MFNFTKTELNILKKLSTPIKIQDFLDSLPRNWGDTYMSPRLVLKEKKAHCFEGALLAATAFWVHGEQPLILDLRAKGDEDHVVALYKRNGYWGAISKTNYATVRFRDPIYKTIRELVLSYFHEYFNNKTGKKALHDYSSKPFNLKQLGEKWVIDEKNLDYVVEALDKAAHTTLVPKKNSTFIRKADKMEMKAGSLVEWKK